MPLLLRFQLLCLESGRVVRTAPAPWGGYQKDLPGHMHKAGASDGSPSSRLTVLTRSEGPGPWPWAAQSSSGQGMARCQLGGARGGAAVDPAEEIRSGLNSCHLEHVPLPWPLPAHCSPSAHGQAPRRRPGQQLLLCSAVRAAQAPATHESVLHTRVTDTLLLASAGAHTPAKGPAGPCEGP